MRRQGWVGSWVRWYRSIGQRGSMDMWVEPRGKSGVWRLLHWARDHQLEQAANTRREIRTKAFNPVLPLGPLACHPSTPQLPCPSVPGASHLLSQGLMVSPGLSEKGLQGESYNPTMDEWMCLEP